MIGFREAAFRFAETVQPHVDLRPGAKACREVVRYYDDRIETTATELRASGPEAARVVDAILDSQTDTLPEQLGYLRLFQASLVMDEMSRLGRVCLEEQL